MTNKEWNDIAEATLASVGVIQSLYSRFLEENDGNEHIALRLTEITWNGIMSGANSKKDADELF